MSSKCQASAPVVAVNMPPSSVNITGNRVRQVRSPLLAALRRRGLPRQNGDLGVLLRLSKWSTSLVIVVGRIEITDSNLKILVSVRLHIHILVAFYLTIFP